MTPALFHLLTPPSIPPVVTLRSPPLRYIVVLMAQAKIYWNRENYNMVEKIFRKSVEVCNEDDTWKLNVAHVLFMQNKYKEAIGLYEPIVKKHYDDVSISECPAVAAEGCEFSRQTLSGARQVLTVCLSVQVEQCNIQECPCRCKPSVNTMRALSSPLPCVRMPFVWERSPLLLFRVVPFFFF